VAQGRIRDEKVARTLFRQIVCAVAFCHSEGFAHRDLKPVSRTREAVEQHSLACPRQAAPFSRLK
jgi:hypothetical protein